LLPAHGVFKKAATTAELMARYGMRPFVRKFLIWLAGAAFSGLAALMGTDPDQAVTNLYKWYGKIAPPPVWLQILTPINDWLMWTFGAIAALLLGWAVRQTWSDRKLMPLREAVGVALSATRDSPTAAFGAGADEDRQVFGYFSAMLKHGTPIYGKTPPAEDWVRLGKVDLGEETLWEMKSIKPHHQPVRITDLSVKRGDLKSFILAVNAER
jgi:hypothetical protein